MQHLHSCLLLIILDISIPIFVDFKAREVLAGVLVHVWVIVDDDCEEVGVVLVEDGIEGVLEAEEVGRLEG